MFIDDHSRGQNPYTADFIWMQFVCNGKKYLRPAFYMEDAKPDEGKNIFVTEQSEWPWRVRFSPPEAGDYECMLLIGENPQTAAPQSTGIRFHVENGSRHGILHTEPGNPRLSFTDGTPFFILGQNICWADEPILRGYQPVHPMFTSGFYDQFHYIHNLADNGGNYVRIIMAPWGHGIETKAVGVYEQDRAYAIDSIMRIAEERGLYVQFCVDLAVGFNANPNDSVWRSPIRNAYQKEGMLAVDLLSDSAALVAFDNFMRYVHSRWAYSANVASIEVLCEAHLWEGFKEKPGTIYNYYTHVKSFLENELCDKEHMIGTSLTENDLFMFRNPALAYVDVHHYDNNLWSNRKRYFVYHRKVDKLGKPFLFGELGSIMGPVNACDPDDWEYCSDITMHNALWSSTFFGSMGTGLCWWQWKNDGYREANYKSLRWFIDSVALGMHDYKDAHEWNGNGLEAYYCIGDSKWSAVGWVHNTSYWWGNTVDTCHDRNGNVMLLPKDDDKPSDPVERASNKFVIKGLHPRVYYIIWFHNPRHPELNPHYIKLKSSILGALRIPFPSGSDWAFKISRAPQVNF